MKKQTIAIFFLIPILVLTPIAIQDVFAGEGGSFKQKFTSPSGKVMVDPVVGINGGSFTMHYQDVVTVTRDTSMDCEVDANPGTFVPPTSVYLNAGPFSDQFGGGEFGATDFILQPAFALTPGDFIHQLMTPTGNPDELGAIIGPIIESHGAGPMSFEITCPAGSAKTGIDTFFDIYVDPSGFVFDACTGEPIQGAEVNLEVDRGNGYEQPFPEFYDSPQNGGIIDPADGGFQITFPDGSYGWDVAPFGYNWKVTVTYAPGYQVPQSLGPYTISSPADAVTDANFFLQPIDQSCAIGGTVLPIDSTALLVAGAQSSTWMIPVVLSVLGIGLFVTSRKSENS